MMMSMLGITERSISRITPLPTYVLSSSGKRIACPVGLNVPKTLRANDSESTHVVARGERLFAVALQQFEIEDP